jgi:hypothetical protein
MSQALVPTREKKSQWPHVGKVVQMVAENDFFDMGIF